MQPNFVFIGPDKTGSTWLFELLRRHPQCYVPIAKDIYFFDRFYDRGMSWYASFFAGAPRDARAIGELSHDYLFSELAAERMARDLPDVKVLTCLRDPVERSFSHYLYLVRSGLTGLSFSEAIEAFPEIVTHSRYATYLKAYLKHFRRSQIGIFFFDQLRSDPRGFARGIFNMLNLEYLEDLPYEKQVLPASRPRYRWLARAARGAAVLARSMGMATMVGVVKRSFVRELLYERYTAANRPRLSETQTRELRAMFRDDIMCLQNMVDRDLSHWLA